MTQVIPAAQSEHEGSAPSELPGLETWRLAASFALLGSLLLLATIATEKWILGEMSEQNPQVIWMLPVSLLLAFVVPAGLVAFAKTRWPRLIGLRVAIWIFSFIALLNFTLFFSRLSKVAILLLAAGLATQVVRSLANRPGMLATFNRRWMPAGYGALFLAALALSGWWKWKEVRILSALPPAAAGAPNVILIILDTVRAANMSLYGYARSTTPTLDSLAEHSVVFDRAIAPSPWTLPSHATMMTGYWPHEHSATWHSALDDEHRTLAEALADRGYRTGGFIANLTFTTREYGMARGFARYRDFTSSWGEVLVNAPLTSTIMNRPQLRRLIGWYDGLGRKLAPAVSRDFLRFVDDDERPFFAFLNYMEAHDPYLPPPPFDSLFGPVSVRRNELMRLWGRSGGRMNKERMSAEEVEGMVAAYDGTIARLDAEIAMLIDSLRSRDLLSNSILIITSDHGEFFGEHGLFEHAKAPYLEVIHVPLLILAEGRVPGGLRDSTSVSLRDIPATVMSLVGNGDSGDLFPGSSLIAGRASRASRPEPVLSQLDRDPKGAQEDRGENTVAAATMFSLILGPYHYLRLNQRRERLFDHRADPRELTELARDSAYARQLGIMRAVLDSSLGITQSDD